MVLSDTYGAIAMILEGTPHETFTAHKSDKGYSWQPRARRSRARRKPEKRRRERHEQGALVLG